MNGEGCWSTVVCRPTERAALGLSGDSDWLLQCRLAIGHRGNHATDASTHPRHDRRLWLEWNDFDDRAQSLIERNPCPVPSPEGVGCVFFVGHGGPHFYAHSNGHAPSVMSGAGTGHHQRPAPGPDRTGSQPPAPHPQRMGSHRLPDSHQPPAPLPPAGAPAPESAHRAEPEPTPESGYRGGRRSTNAEPIAAEDYHGRRHRSVAPGRDVSGPAQPGPVVPQAASPAGAAVPPGVVPDAQAEVADHSSEPVSAAEAARRAEISAALDDVAVALARLAAALRP